MKKTILLTGATGVMGRAGFEELWRRRDRFDITLLARPSKKNRKMLARYDGQQGLRIVWGDLTRAEDVAEAVRGADVVLHVGGMVSPAADYYPTKTRRVNPLAARNIVEAVKAQPNADDIKVVYIGTVAQTSDRNEPMHWGRTGDPIFISAYDHYAISKTEAERIIADSGLKHWVSLRQSGILYPGILKKIDPIMFHVPIRNVLEWATIEDSGRLLANVCEDWVPETFWNKFYNIGSGEQYRLSNYEFESKIFAALGMPALEKVFDTRWFALRNFHGQWYLDSDKLEAILHFRHNIPVDEYFRRMRKALPWYYSLARIVPAFVLRRFMRSLAYAKRFGTMDWIKNRDERRIAAHFGSYEAWQAIPDWRHFDLSRPAGIDKAVHTDHGYDESKPLEELDLDDMRAAARFRGGECLAESMVRGDMATKLTWRCRCGHTFDASPALVLLGGHWCPECLPAPWNYGEEAAANPFIAQVWYPSHSRDEHDIYDESIFDGWEK